MSWPVESFASKSKTWHVLKAHNPSTMKAQSDLSIISILWLLSQVATLGPIGSLISDSLRYFNVLLWRLSSWWLVIYLKRILLMQCDLGALDLLLTPGQSCIVAASSCSMLCPSTKVFTLSPVPFVLASLASLTSFALLFFFSFRFSVFSWWLFAPSGKLCFQALKRYGVLIHLFHLRRHLRLFRFQPFNHMWVTWVCPNAARWKNKSCSSLPAGQWILSRLC